MDDPTEEVIMSLDITLKITDTVLNETKTVGLAEFHQVGTDWLANYVSMLSSMSREMEAPVAALAAERVKKGT